jgi:hypothetical protein
MVRLLQNKIQLNKKKDFYLKINFLFFFFSVILISFVLFRRRISSNLKESANSHFNVKKNKKILFSCKKKQAMNNFFSNKP